jgi:hypothetical protein
MNAKPYRVDCAWRMNLDGEWGHFVWYVVARNERTIAECVSERSARRVCRLLNEDSARRRASLSDGGTPQVPEQEHTP